MNGYPKHLCLALSFLFLAYGFFSVAYTAIKLPNTFDEPVYRAASKHFLGHANFTGHVDHPPVATVVGALVPGLTKTYEFRTYRYGHVGLYAMFGVYFAVLLYLYFGVGALLWFSGFYGLSPNLKAMASLHVIDSDLSLLLTASALSAIVFFKSRRKGFYFASFLFFGLALCTKLTAVFLAPFLGLSVVYKKRGLIQRASLALSGTALGFLLAYQLSVLKLVGFWQSIQFQLEKAERGFAFLFGEVSPMGFWSYYFFYMLAKVPPFFSLSVILALALAAKKRKSDSLTWYLLLPSALLLLILTFAKVQIGLRYFLPGLMLLFLAAAIYLGRLRMNNLYLFAALTCGFLLTAAVDVKTLRHDSYISFVNPFVPNPTRNMGDSNIDWNQALPQHIWPDYPPTLAVCDLMGAWMQNPEQTFFVRIGATELNRLWVHNCSLAPYFLRFSPRWVVAGSEIFKVTADTMAQLAVAPPFISGVHRKEYAQLTGPHCKMAALWDPFAAGQKALVSASKPHYSEETEVKNLEKFISQNLEVSGRMQIHSQIELEVDTTYVLFAGAENSLEVWLGERRLINMPGRVQNRYEWKVFSSDRKENGLKVVYDRHQPPVKTRLLLAKLDCKS